MFEKQMTKVKGRKDSYAIYFGKSDEVNEAKFKKNIVLGDDSKCHVIVSFKDDFDFLIKQREDKDQQIMTLNQRIKQLEEEIAQKSSTNKSSTRELYLKIDDLNKQLTKKEKTHQDDLSAIHSEHEKKIEAINDEYNEKINQLNKELSAKGEEIQELKLKYERGLSDMKHSLLEKHHKEESAITSDKQQIIDTLKDEISDLKLQHQADISKYKETLITLRTKDNNEIASHNKKQFRIIDDLKDLGFFEKHSSKYGNLLNELHEVLDDFEIINKNKLLTIEEDFKKIEIEASEENNAKGD